MGYYIRNLGVRNPDIHIDELIEALSADGLVAKIEFDPDEQLGQWSMLRILNFNGEVLAELERDVVKGGELAQGELNEFKEEIQEYKPASAVEWLINYFDQVSVIYAFQIFNAAFDDGNYEIINCIRTRIWNITGGILQADHEGFSNEEGFHILWQFSDDVTGEWSCAVRNLSGHWDKFIMDLGDREQRKAFQDGEVPGKAKLLD